MKTWMKRVAGLVLVFAMVLTMIPAITAKADTYTKDITLYVGDVYTVGSYSFDKVDAKSSNSKAVKVSPDKSSKSNFVMEAKKPSKKPVKVTASYTDSFWAPATEIYNITVKKPNLSTSIKQTRDGNFLLTVKNTTKTHFERVGITYKLADVNGGIAKEDDITLYDIPVGKTVYYDLYCSTYDATVDVAKSSAKVKWTEQDWNYKFTDVSKKLTIKKSAKESTSDYGSKQTDITVKYTNKADKEVEGKIFVRLFDKDNNIIGVEDASIYSLNSKATNTKTFTVYHNTHKNFDHYDVQYFVFTKEKK